MSYLYIKSLHIIFMVCWFAGIFYLVRLMIYFKESEERELNSRKILQDQAEYLMAKVPKHSRLHA